MYRVRATRSGYTRGMKTAVSIPDEIFERAERLARRCRRSRSDVYAAALDEYVARHAPEEVGDENNSFLAAAGRLALNRVEW